MLLTEISKWTKWVGISLTFNWVWCRKWDNSSVLDMHSVWLDPIYLGCELLHFFPHIITCLSLHRPGGICCFFLFQHSISDALIIFFESRRKQIRSETLSFVCKEKTAAISQIWEPSSAIWPWLEEMWVFLHPMHPIWWMVFFFDRQRLAKEPEWELEMCIYLFWGRMF